MEKKHERTTCNIKFKNGKADKWKMTTNLIRKKDNPKIIKLDLNNENRKN